MLFAVESSRYGFALDLRDLPRARFGRRSGPAPRYAASLEASADWLQALPAAELAMEIEREGRTYRAVSARGGTAAGAAAFDAIRMWESGRFVQHYDFLDLTFRSSDGAVLPCEASLDVVAWPGSLTLTGRISPAHARGAGDGFSEATIWTNTRCRLRLAGAEIACHAEKAVPGPWSAGQTHELTVTHPTPTPAAIASGLSVRCTYGDADLPVRFDPRKNCRVAAAVRLRRPFKGGYTDIREYDDFALTIQNPGEESSVPFLLDVRPPANITGLCPILCDAEGRPTGIPVQLSKNWHHKETGPYLMACGLLPSRTGMSRHLLRIAYGFYGSLPSASHAQLSLVGYGGNGRWDQLAIGCWGETFCLDMDMSLVEVAVTDIRALMVRNGRDGERWRWTGAGWGGDWLGVFDSSGGKRTFSGMRTAYLAHGPCLTDVRHSGFYGGGREVSLEARVQTVRTDDYARTFQTLRYTFNAPSETDRLWLYKMGGSTDMITPRVACGNREGLTAEWNVPPDLKPGRHLVDRRYFEGPGPWWISFPGATFPDTQPKGTGYRALVIRSYRAVAAGRTHPIPLFSLPVHRVHKGGHGVDINFLMLPPEGVTAFQPGDTVEMLVEWITLPRTAEDYYGPNETFRDHLTRHPSSWRTAHREALANDLDVHVRGGTLTARYPVVVQADQLPVHVTIRGGAGAVPLCIRGLASATGHALFEVVNGREVRLDQSARRNDFWQIDADESGTGYMLTYNLPLDNKPVSAWVLRREAE